ncbi:hypothetical protein NL676_034813 [Syzygium grande]|nr:hypothetical protein NL676_034813 [Syzygium grande]
MTSQVVSRISVDTLTIQGVLTEKRSIGCSIPVLENGSSCNPRTIDADHSGLVYEKLLVGLGEKIQEASAVAGGIAEQALSSIRTVYSYVGEEQTAKSHKILLEPVMKLGIKQGMIKGMAIGIAISYTVWALQGWYGSILVTDKGFKVGNVFAAGANVAASHIFEMIGRVPDIDLVDKEGTMLSNVRGEVEFKDVYFAYPSRLETLVLKKFSLRVMASQTVGVVGRSGWYQYEDSSAQMAEKSNGLGEPRTHTFANMIKENILFGKEGATMEEIIKAAKAANAHNFITQLPNGYDTQVGQLGIQMSEGQKQRISIARALLRDPRILLLDEATSALNSQSEKAAQDALNEALIGRTTFVVAHRLSALSNANSIAVIQSGEVIESGSHDKLMENDNGPYSTMAQLQRTSGSDGTAPSSQGVDFKKPASIIRKTVLLNELTNDPLIRKLHSFCLGALLSVYVVEDHHMIRSQTRVYCLAFLALAIFAFITNVIQHYFFGVMGENLTKRLREALFDKILTFEVEWFDQEDNNSGALCSRLATDAAMLRNLVGDLLAFFTQAISAATLAVILGLLLSWRLALVATALQPLVIGAFYIRMIMTKSISKKILKSQNQSSELASEAVANPRVITAFDSEQKILNLYENTQTGPREVSHKQSWFGGGRLLIAQLLTTVNSALIFWYGGRLLYHGEITYKHVFQTFFFLVLTG